MKRWPVQCGLPVRLMTHFAHKVEIGRELVVEGAISDVAVRPFTISTLNVATLSMVPEAIGNQARDQFKWRIRLCRNTEIFMFCDIRDLR